MKSIKLAFLFLVLVSCSAKNNDDEKLMAFLKSNRVETVNSAVVLVNPDFCGACTQETVDWLTKFDQQFQGKKYIIKTAEIDSVLKVQLDKTDFKQILSSEEKVQRLGFGGAVSTLLKIKNDEIIEQKVIKGLPGY